MAFLPSRFPLLATLTLFSCLAPAGARAQARADTPGGTLAIPGGFQAVARIAGLDESSDPDLGIERIFSSVLATEAPRGSLATANRVREELISYFKEYSQFLQFLAREHLAPPGWNAGSSLEAMFPLAGKAEELERTRKLLWFFGIQYRLNQAGQDTVQIEFHAPSRRQILHRTLNLGIPGGGPHELRLSLKTDRLPMLLDETRWARILAPSSSEALIQRFMEDPNAMLLYLALNSCSRAAAQSLVESIGPRQLLQSAEVLSLFGPDLRFKNGNLTFPGSSIGWTELFGPPARALSALFSKGGTPLLLYSSIAAAPPDVQNYLTGNAATLKGLLKILEPYASGGFSGTVGAAVGEDLPRLLRLTKVDSAGLVLDLDERVARACLGSMVPDEVGEGRGPVRMTPRLLSALLPRPGVSPYSKTSRSGTLEFFRYLAETHPGWLSTPSLVLLAKNPEQSPVMLDLIGDFAPAPELLTAYLRYCGKLAQARPNNREHNRIRTSQSVFFLISVLFREGALSQMQAEDLLAGALRAFEPEDEAMFAIAVAEFLSAKLVPAISKGHKGSGDELLSALSGNVPRHTVAYRGKELVLDLSARNYRQMYDTLQTQSYTPMPVLLDIYQLLREIQARGNRVNSDETMRRLSELLNSIRTAERAPGSNQPDPEGTAQVDIDSLKRAIASAGSWTGAKAAPATRAKEIAAQVHTELGVTLLTYCYAYGARPETDILAFDPNFVRKHRFYPYQLLNGSQTWRRSRYVQEDEAGGFIEGSLAGIEFELTRLKTAQVHSDSGNSWDIGMAPAILFGIRKVRPDLRTERAQEYVALTTELGRNLLTQSQTDDKLGEWIGTILSPLLSQRRLEQIGLPRGGIGVLSRSELFLLGQAYYMSGEWKSRGCDDVKICSTAGRLDEIVPNRQSVEYNAFYNEVSQYGILLHNRIGLSHLSFNMIDSYERLERSLRAGSLYDRICDLKIRIAELNHTLGIPARAGEAEAGLALRHILPPFSPAITGSWDYAIARINGLTEKAAQGWMDDLLSHESLSTGLKDIGAPDL